MNRDPERERDGRSYPDALSHRHTFGLVVPATNTSMEHDLWRLIFANQGPGGLGGVGLHTSNVRTPRPQLGTPQDLVAYRDQFLRGLGDAVDQALLAQPDSILLGMSLEHILEGLAAVRASVAEVVSRSGVPWATWHDAIPAALDLLGARRIGLLTPFDDAGNRNAEAMFRDLGIEVVASYGFACANALEIAHVPDRAKEQAILERLATADHRLDAVVQCGTNMSVLDVTERLEPVLGIPILGINPVTFWYALRRSGLQGPIRGGGRLLREHGWTRAPHAPGGR